MGLGVIAMGSGAAFGYSLIGMLRVMEATHLQAATDPLTGRTSSQEITALRPEQIARRGVARSFQITSLFENLTPREHVEIALDASGVSGNAIALSPGPVGSKRTASTPTRNGP